MDRAPILTLTPDDVRAAIEAFVAIAHPDFEIAEARLIDESGREIGPTPSCLLLGRGDSGGIPGLLALALESRSNKTLALPTLSPPIALRRPNPYGNHHS